MLSDSTTNQRALLRVQTERNRSFRFVPVSDPEEEENPLKQLAGGDGELDDVGGHTGGVSARSNFRAAAGECLELPAVQGASGDGHVVAAVAILAFDERLDDLCGGQLVRDLREIERIAAGRIISRKRQRSNRVNKIARRRIDVQRRKGNRDGHNELLESEVKEVQEVQEVQEENEV